VMWCLIFFPFYKQLFKKKDMYHKKAEEI